MRPLAPALALVASVIVLGGASLTAAAAPATTPTIERATTRWQSVADDARRKQRRDLWMAAITGLEEAAGKAKCPARALGLRRAGAASEGLADVSRLRSDVERAESFYVRAAEACPDDAAASDAWTEAARLALRRRAEGAVVARYEASAKAASRRQAAAKAEPRAKTVTAKASSAASDDRGVGARAAALEEATKAWHALREDPKRRLQRMHWTSVLEAFERLGTNSAPAAEAALAFMRAGRAAEELARISGRAADLDEAVRLYRAVAERCPEATLADDALVSAAAVESARHRYAEARALLQEAVAKKGDQASLARRRLAELPAPAVEVRAVAANTKTEQTTAVAPVAAKATPPAVLAHAHDPDVPEHEDAAALAELMASLDQRVAEAAGAAKPVVTARPEIEEVLQDIRTNAVGSVEFSLSEQMGLKVRRIVVDAGHGGHDTGAIGPSGVYEKDVTLAISLVLATELRRRDYEVVLTREADVYVSLEERTAIANRVQADLFISVHANAHRSRKKGGIETYSLNVTSDRYAMRLAARENAMSERSASDLHYLLADLATRANTVDSNRLARLVQKELVSQTARHGRLRDLGTKQALFYVLLGVRMPAVLVETAFLSNPAEEKKLVDDAFQTTVARAIADGVDAFVERRLRLASAD